MKPRDSRGAYLNLSGKTSFGQNLGQYLGQDIRQPVGQTIRQNLGQKLGGFLISCIVVLTVWGVAASLDVAATLIGEKLHADIRSSYALERISRAIDEAGKEGKRR